MPSLDNFAGDEVLDYCFFLEAGRQPFMGSTVFRVLRLLQLAQKEKNREQASEARQHGTQALPRQRFVLSEATTKVFAPGGTEFRPTHCEETKSELLCVPCCAGK